MAFDIVIMWQNNKALVRVAERLVEALRYNPDGRRLDSRWRHGILHWHGPSSRTKDLVVDSASKRHDYQEYLLGAKAAGT
jgi:hypothetical protein